MNIALKEWESVVTALDRGLQIGLLRKGGIVEADRGGFRLREPKFLLFPTFEHEHYLMLKEEYKDLMRPGCAGEISLSLCATVSDIFEVTDLQSLLDARDHFIQNETFFRKRLEYKPELPLYCILVRASRLSPGRAIPDRPSYAGCKSWVHLTEEIDESDARPVLSDEAYETKREALLSVLHRQK